MYVACMARKNISIDTGAYQRLKDARLGPWESFSQVIRRARWNEERKTCGALLAALKDMPVADEEVIARLEEAQRADSPPNNPWA